MPPGCPACRSWPLVWLIGDGDPEPPVACWTCGRESTTETRVYMGVRMVDLSLIHI